MMLQGTCLLYTSDAADDLTRVDLGFRNLELNVKGYVKSTSGPSGLTV